MNFCSEGENTKALKLVAFISALGTYRKIFFYVSVFFML